MWMVLVFVCMSGYVCACVNWVVFVGAFMWVFVGVYVCGR